MPVLSPGCRPSASQAAIAEEHMAAYAQEPAAECQFVRDGPLIAASALAHMGQMERARLLAAIPGDPAADPDTASDWQAWYLVASGDPAAARAIAGPKALGGRGFGSQHAVVLIEALVALEECGRVAWPTIVLAGKLDQTLARQFPGAPHAADFHARYIDAGARLAFPAPNPEPGEDRG